MLKTALFKDLIQDVSHKYIYMYTCILKTALFKDLIQDVSHKYIYMYTGMLKTALFKDLIQDVCVRAGDPGHLSTQCYVLQLTHFSCVQLFNLGTLLCCVFTRNSCMFM